MAIARRYHALCRNPQEERQFRRPIFNCRPDARFIEHSRTPPQAEGVAG
jgi:hypothetical protein